jgi:hypothetical protein
MPSEDSDLDRRNEEALESYDNLEPPGPRFSCAICGDEADVFTPDGWRCSECYGRV